MALRDTFVPLNELASELHLRSGAVRYWASRARVPLFRCPGEREALLRHRDADRLRDELALGRAVFPIAQRPRAAS